MPNSAQSTIVPFRMRIADTLMNLISGLGTSKDKSYHTEYTLRSMDRAQLEAAYRGDWIARKVCKIPAQDMTREWRSWQADDGQIEKIEALERQFGLQYKVRTGMARARLYGGCAIIIGMKDGAHEQPLDVDKIQQGDLQYLHVANVGEVTADQLEQSLVSELYGLPKFYSVTPVGGAPVKIHPSRVVRLVGEEVPDTNSTQPVSGMWGDSVLQAIDDAVKNVGLCSGGIATLVHEAKFDVIKMPNFMANVTTDDYRERVIERMKLANVAKSTVNALLLDKEEEWERINASFAGLPDILKLYLLIACGAADIPATRMLGQSAAGLNATGEGDLRNYYDSITAYQKNDLSPAMSLLDEVIVRSALGKADPAIHYLWRPLWQMDEVQKAEVANKKANTFKIDLDSGVFTPEEAREIRINQLTEDGTYPGIEAATDGTAETDLDESDPQVQEQFAASAAREPAKEALNGAQISSLLGIVEAIKGGTLPPDSARVVLKVSFPSLTETDIDEIIDPVEVDEESPAGEQPPPPVSPSPGATGEASSGAEPGESGAAAVADAKPRTLYVRRDVVNAKEIANHYRKQGFKKIVDDMHVTICYSRTPLDWMRVSEAFDDKMELPAGGPRVTEPLGDEGAMVLLFASSSLRWRHQDIVRAGASHDYDDYHPHITISYENRDPSFTDKVEPYTGKIVLGPEIFEEIK